jgi:hypothetical protein
MEEIKSVRLSYDFKKNNYYKDKDGRSLIKTSDSSLNNYKLTLFKGDKEKDRRVVLYRVGQNNQLTIENKFPPISINYSNRYKDWLNDPDRYIEAWLSSPNNKDFSINQDPWQESVPNRINFGSEIYFLNNASQVLILWQSAEKSGFEEGGVDLIYPYNLFGKEIEKSNNQSIFGDYFSDDDGNELDIPRWAPEKQTYTQPISGTSEEIDYGSKNFDLETGLPITGSFGVGYAAKPSQIKAHVITKHLVIWPPGDETEEGSIILLDDKNFSKIGEVNENTNIAVGSMTYPGNVKDIDILRDIVDSWNRKVPNYGLDICSKKTEFCKTLTYISPIDNLNQVVEPETNSVENSDKLDLKVLIPENLQLKVKQDIPSLKIYFGEIPQENAEQDGFDFGDFNSDISLLGEEFIESEFGGDESVFEEQDYPDVQTRIETLNEAKLVNNEPYVPGKYTLDLIPGSFLDNSKNPIRCCQIDGKPVNIKIADSLLDMIAAAKKDGINLIVNSGFRPGYGSSINAKSEKGVKVTADSQEVLWNQNCAGKAKCNPDTAKPGSSKHGSGLAIDFNTGTRTGAKRISKMDPTKAKNYEWLVKNSWRFGYLRTVPTEEWHFEYWPQLAKKGPYAKLAKTNELYYADLGINNLQIS